MKTLETIIASLAYAIQTPQRMRLRRNVRAWLPAAIKKGPRSVEWDFVAKWSFQLRMMEIR